MDLAKESKSTSDLTEGNMKHRRNRPKFPISEVTHRNVIIDEIDEAMLCQDKKYVKTLVPLIKPLPDESDMEESILSTGAEPSSSIWDICFCCCR
jgi:hypothetical protein